jgi:hypothetical protein
MRTLMGALILGGLLAVASLGVAQAQPIYYEPQIDHFKCYQVIPIPRPNHGVGETVGLVDQFEEREVRVTKAVRICLPVNKAHGIFGDAIVEHPDDHLVCYRTKEPQFPFDPRAVAVFNQFGSQILQVTGRERTLCVPSLKCVVDPETGHCPE